MTANDKKKEQQQKQQKDIPEGHRTAPAITSTKPYEVIITVPFLFCTIVGCAVITFSLGSLCHQLMISKFMVDHSERAHHIQQEVRHLKQIDSSGLPKTFYPPDLTNIPKTIYSSKNFIDDTIHASSNTILAEKRTTERLPVEGNQDDDSHYVCGGSADDSNVGATCRNKQQKINKNDPTPHSDGEVEHEPAGQHLLIDMENVDEVFLNSEVRIAQAMLDIVNESGLTMLSYHCHGLQPMGISCVGVLLESHISVHTWPLEGVILLDLFTCGPNPLEPLLPLIVKKFGVPKKITTIPAPTTTQAAAADSDITESTKSAIVPLIRSPNINWSHKKRGFRTPDPNSPFETTGVQGFDIDRYVEGWLEFDMKTSVVSLKTEYQTIDIYDIIDPSFLRYEQYHQSLQRDSHTYEAEHPECFQPDRMLFSSGSLQSRRYGEVAYHEALVHPALITHDSPRRVVIIGGGDGATLREVLKHNTIEHVTMIEIDQVMVNLSKTYLPEWSDCSFLADRTPSCFDDPRAEIVYTNAFAWFLENYLDKEKVKGEDKYDIIIMDALETFDTVDVAGPLFNSAEFIKAISNSLAEDGIFVSQSGEDDQPDSVPDSFFIGDNYDFVEQVALHGDFATVSVYSEGHTGYFGVWKFMIAMKSRESRVRWYGNEAEINLELRLRAMPTVDAMTSPFRFFDGATQMTYQQTSRVTENKFCQKEPQPTFCEHGHGYDPERQNIPIDSLEVGVSKIEGAGRGIFFKRDFPEGSFTCIDEGSFNIVFMPSTTAIVQDLFKKSFTDQWKTFDFYLFGYGFSHDYFGGNGFSIDSSIMTFINHGCNGTYIVGLNTSVTELTADLDHMPPELLYYEVESAVYSPFIDRNHMIYINGHDTLLKDVKAGEEMLDNYLTYLNEDNWSSGIKDYRAQCLKQAKGAINVYETDFENEAETETIASIVN